jgi:acetyl-CoA synthetase (ADP-forming)/acetyltransferase
MSIRNLDRLFQPRSVAVIGASDNPQRIGTRVLANLLDGEFAQGGGRCGRSIPSTTLHGLPCYRG